MKTRSYFAAIAVPFTLLALPSQALTIQEHSVFLHSDTINATSLQHDGFAIDDFFSSGIAVNFSSNFDSDGIGELIWSFTNNLDFTLEDTQLFVFIDAEIDEPSNTYFNESGALESVTGQGSSDNLADSWEIDEPGYLFGDIFDNLWV